MRRFLTLKHWQLFGILIVLPVFFQTITIGTIISSNFLESRFYYFPLVTILFIGLLFAWLYTLGANLYDKLPPITTLNIARFKLFLVIPIVYILLFSVLAVSIISSITNGEQLHLASYTLIIPLHLFSMFCIFYCVYFIAKALKTIELQRTVTFSDYAGEFILIWLFPLGIWIIQPRINKLFDKSIKQ